MSSGALARSSACSRFGASVIVNHFRVRLRELIAALVALVQRKPESFLDGRVFRSAFGGLSDQMARRFSVERIVDFLGDVAVLADRPIRRSPEELQRGRLSCLLLEQELAPTVEDQLV